MYAYKYVYVYMSTYTYLGFSISYLIHVKGYRITHTKKECLLGTFHLLDTCIDSYIVT